MHGTAGRDWTVEWKEGTDASDWADWAVEGRGAVKERSANKPWHTSRPFHCSGDEDQPNLAIESSDASFAQNVCPENISQQHFVTKVHVFLWNCSHSEWIGIWSGYSLTFHHILLSTISGSNLVFLEWVGWATTHLLKLTLTLSLWILGFVSSGKGTQKMHGAKNSLLSTILFYTLPMDIVAFLI